MLGDSMFKETFTTDFEKIFYKWIYITTGSGDGWIKTDYISWDIGGLVLRTPEECINEELVWAYER